MIVCQSGRFEAIIAALKHLYATFEYPDLSAFAGATLNTPGEASVDISGAIYYTNEEDGYGATITPDYPYDTPHNEARYFAAPYRFSATVGYDSPTQIGTIQVQQQGTVANPYSEDVRIMANEYGYPYMSISFSGPSGFDVDLTGYDLVVKDINGNIIPPDEPAYFYDDTEFWGFEQTFPLAPFLTATLPSYAPVLIATSYANAGGTGDRQSIITVTESGTGSTGSPSALVNGTSADTYKWSSGFGGEIIFDFGTPKVVSEFTWSQSYNQPHGAWGMSGGKDGVSWESGGDTDLFLDNGVFNTGNTREYRYYRLHQRSGSKSNGPWLREIEFKISE